MKSPEDAVPVDLDGDGNYDVVSCCEGNTKSVYVHWANTNPKRQRGDKVDADPRSRFGLVSEWTTEAFPVLAGKRLAMFCLPMQVDGENGIDLIIGSKGKDADVGWLRSPKNLRDLSAWTWHSLTKAGWIMSLVPRDMDGDGDDDVLVSDRRGANRGVYWLERPEPKDATGKWSLHFLRDFGGEVMFLDVGWASSLSKNTEQKGKLPHEIIVPTHDHHLWLARGKLESCDQWEVEELPWPKGIGNGKSAAFADVDLDSRRDIVISCETREQVSGLVWLSQRAAGFSPAVPDVHDISGIAGPKGLKFDRLELIDLDADGDQDVLTTEERSLWGVVWFENPAK